MRSPAPIRTATLLAWTATLLAAPANAFAQVPAVDAARTAAPPPPAVAFRLNSTSPDALAAFDAAFDEYLELAMHAAAEGFRRAHEIDPTFHLAAAFALTLQSRAPAIADEIQRLQARNGTPGLVETLQFVSMRERSHGRADVANALLAAAARAAYEDPRLLAEYHLWLPYGNTNRMSVARLLRDRDPASYRYHAYVAMALTLPADSTEALHSMAEALRLEPARPFVHYAAGELLARLGRFAEATAHYTHALQRSDSYHLALLGRARVAMAAGNFDAARRDLERTAEQAVYVPHRGLARRAAALTWLHGRDIDRATREMQSVIAAFERDNVQEQRWISQLGLAHAAMAIMAAVRADRPAVERHLAAQQAVQGADSEAATGWSSLAWSLLGDGPRARAAFRVYEQLVSPATSASTHAMVLVAEGRHDDALQAAGTSTNGFALLAGYRALTALGRHDEARARLQQLLTSRSFAVDAVAVPVARYLHGAGAPR